METALTGSESSRLIIIPGNSGSGKSQRAHAVRDARARGVAIVGHDVLRREILHVRDRPGAPSVPYVDLSARFALDDGLDVVIEGILHAEIYGEMLSRPWYLSGDRIDGPGEITFDVAVSARRCDLITAS